MEQKLTFWQKLTNVVENGATNPFPTNSFEQELLQPTNLTDYNVNKLELQQTQYLRNQGKKVQNDLYQKSVYYETNRIGSYMDFESMEYFPEISTALDIFSEEATTLNPDGKVLTIKSDSARIKSILETLFNEVLDVNSNLPAWTRNTVKYGDNFLFLKTEKKQGVTKATQLRNIEIKRVEGDGITNDNVKFLWETNNTEFNAWQIAHFRLVGDDKKLPHGTSILEKARKIFRQLILAEDAMLVYRLQRAPERRVFKIDVGNMDDADIAPYIDKVSAQFKRTTQVNSANGQLDLRMNQSAISEDYFVPVRNSGVQTVIDTLPGASNLSDIEDISYLQNKLFSALRVPKTFLGFDAEAGDGKNLAMQDIRFARTINRIQQSMLQELNKIAIIHLFLLGFEDELTNFSLSLTNPSTQAEILQVEAMAAKVDLYTKAVVDAGNGWGAMSMTKAKKEILGFSDDEIILDLQQQRIEKAESLRNSEEDLRAKNLNSGIFNNLDTKYFDANNPNPAAAGGDPSVDMGGDAGGGAEMPAMDGAAPMDGAEPAPEGPDAGGAEPAPMNESKLLKDNRILNENINNMLKNINKLID